jgi:hypothetical protein
MITDTDDREPKSQESRLLDMLKWEHVEILGAVAPTGLYQTRCDETFAIREAVKSQIARSHTELVADQFILHRMKFLSHSKILILSRSKRFELYIHISVSLNIGKQTFNFILMIQLSILFASTAN